MSNDHKRRYVVKDSTVLVSGKQVVQNEMDKMVAQGYNLVAVTGTGKYILTTWEDPLWEGAK